MRRSLGWIGTTLLLFVGLAFGQEGTVGVIFNPQVESFNDDCAVSVAAEFGYDLVVSDAVTVEEQIAAVENLLASGVNGLVVVPIDLAALIPLLDRAREEGVVVVTRGPQTLADCQASDVAVREAITGEQGVVRAAQVEEPAALILDNLDTLQPLFDDLNLTLEDFAFDRAVGFTTESGSVQAAAPRSFNPAVEFQELDGQYLVIFYVESLERDLLMQTVLEGEQLFARFLDGNGEIVDEVEAEVESREPVEVPFVEFVGENSHSVRVGADGVRIRIRIRWH